MFSRNSGMIATLAFSLIAIQPAFAASRDKHDLPEPFLSMERNYLKETPDLQKVMDVMIATEEPQVKDPTQDILHNRLCAAFVSKMTMDQKMPAADRRLAPRRRHPAQHRQGRKRIGADQPGATLQGP